MSNQYQGGIITKNPATPTGPFETGAAPGIWTITQQAGYAKQGVWPTAGLAANYIEDVFSTYLYTGTGAALTITNNIDLSTKGGLVWLKDRNSGAKGHGLFDTARGVNKKLQTPSTGAEFSAANQLTAFNTTGFALGTDTDINGSGTTYASWTFREQAKFFDVVTYTGNGTTQNIAHSLGSTVGCVIVKCTNASASWFVWHRGQTAGYYSTLNTTSAQTNANSTITFGNNTTYVDPTSTQFTVGSNGNINDSGNTYVAYLFAHDAGGFGLTGTDNVISCGGYTGDGTTDGSKLVSLGYEPQWVLVKRTDSSTNGGWHMIDVMRGMPTATSASSITALLLANTSAAEVLDSTGGPSATGFRPVASLTNTNGATYIYIAIRRGPMKVPTTGTSVFTPVARSGTGATATVSNTITTDLIISMTRNTGQNSGVWDRLRGFTKYLATTSTAIEGTGADTVTAMNNTAYVLGADSATDRINRSGYTYANWTFSRAPSFFDEVCYTGTGSATTFSHNLQAVPELMIVKRRSLGGGQGWAVYAAPLGNTQVLTLNLTDAAFTFGYWNNTTPTSSVFSLNADSDVNSSSYTYVAYLFATCAGVSKVGSYTGTGTTKQIDCGFTAGARFVLIKRTDSTGDWYVWDSARGIIAGNDPYLLLNSTAAEVTNTDYVDTYSAGFEISSTAPAAINASAGTFIFLAIA